MISYFEALKKNKFLTSLIQIFSKAMYLFLAIMKTNFVSLVKQFAELIWLAYFFLGHHLSNQVLNLHDWTFYISSQLRDPEVVWKYMWYKRFYRVIISHQGIVEVTPLARNFTPWANQTPTGDTAHENMRFIRQELRQWS